MYAERTFFTIKIYAERTYEMYGERTDVRSTDILFHDFFVVNSNTSIWNISNKTEFM